MSHLYEQRIRELFHRLVDYATVYSIVVISVVSSF